MNNEKSYSNLMKSCAMEQKKGKEEQTVLQIYIEIIMHEALLKAEKEKLAVAIDKALDEKDKETFTLLSKKYTELAKRFGT